MLLIKNYKPICFCILKPKTSGQGVDNVCFKLGFDSWIRVETVGMSGGIWVLWKNDLKITVSKTHPQFILLNVCDKSKKQWMMAVVYGSPSRTLRHKI